MSSFDDLTAKPATTAPKRKARSRAKGGKRGKKSWVIGTKLVFFETRKNQWRFAVQGDKAGAFYTLVAKLFIIKYGWFWDLSLDLEEDVEDPDDEAAEQLDEDEGGLTDEEEEARWTYYTDLRTKIGQWFRYHYRKITGTDNWGTLLANGEGLPVKPPRKRRVSHVYYDHYYASRVKASFEVEWAKISAQPVPEGQKKPSRVNEMNKWTALKFAEETPAFRAMVEEMTAVENASNLEKWENARKVEEASKTPEDYDEALRHAAVALQPFADAAASRYGMVCSILLAGPIGANGGAIEVRSVHSGTTRGAVQKTWPQADHEGFRVVVNTMLRFGILAFSQAECDARTLSGTVAAQPTITQPAIPFPSFSTPAASGSAGQAGGSAATTGASASGPPSTPASTMPAPATTTPAPTTSGGATAAPLTTPAPATSGGATAAPPTTTAAATSGGATPAATTTGAPTAKSKGKGGRGRKRVGAGAKQAVIGPAPARPKPRPLAPHASASAGDGAGGAGASGVSNDDETGAGAAKDSGAGVNAGVNGSASNETPDGGSGGVGSVSGSGGAETNTGDGGAATGEGDEEPHWASRTQTRWPTELQKLYAAMERNAQWGKQWEELADGIVAFEEACGFPFDRVGMAKQGRVQMVERWMQIGRPYSYGPTPTSAETATTLHDEFWSWWIGLQPVVRVREDGGLDRPVGLDWGRLRDHAGRNGLGLVCLTLLWWGTLVHRTRGGEGVDPAAIADWEVAVEEVGWTLESLVKMGGLSKKRAGDRGVVDKEPKKRRI